MLQKVGIVVGLTTVAALMLSPLAFADDDCQYGGGNSHGGSVQNLSELGNNSNYEGVAGFFAADQSHDANHDDECYQENSSDIE